MNTSALHYRFTLLFLILTLCGAGQSAWTALDAGVSVDLNSVDFINEQTGIAVGMMGTIIKTTDGGNTWTSISAGSANNLSAIRYVDNDRVIIGGDQGIILSSQDGGDTWSAVQSGMDYNIYGLAIDPVSGRGIAGGSGNTIIWTTDFGASWTYIQGGFMNDFYGACMGGGEFGAVVGRNAIFQSLVGYTTNGGQSFNGQSFYPTFNNVGFESTSYDCHCFSSTQGFIVGALWDGQGFVTSALDWGNQFWDAVSFAHRLFGVYFSNELQGVVVGGDFSFNTLISETFDGGATWQTASVQGNGKTMLDVKLIGSTGYAVGLDGEILKKETATWAMELTTHEINLNIFPNPARKTLNISIGEDFVKASYRIINPQGVVMSNRYFTQKNLTVDLEDLKPGIYLMSLLVDDKAVTRRFAIE